MLPRDVGRSVFFQPTVGPARYKTDEEISAEGTTGNLWIVSEVVGVHRASHLISTLLTPPVSHRAILRRVRILVILNPQTIDS